jgi:hypothetical protein
MPTALPATGRAITRFRSGRTARHPAFLIPCWLSLATACVRAEFPAPRLAAIHPPGGRQASTIEVTIRGTDLEDAADLIFSHPGITASPLIGLPNEYDPEPPAVPGRLRVSIAADVPPGVYDAAVRCRHGISSPRSFMVGRFPEIQKAGVIATLETALAVPSEASINGQVDPNTADHYAIECVAGQRMVVVVWAGRIDSRVLATCSVFDPAGKPLPLQQRLSGDDPSFSFTANQPGRHVIRIADRFARGGEDFFYRVEVFTGGHILGVFPPVMQAGMPATLRLVGRSLGAGATPLEGGSDIEQLPLQVATDSLIAMPSAAGRRLLSPGDITAPLAAIRSGPTTESTSPPLILQTDLPVAEETEPNNDPDGAQPVPFPIAVAGRLHPRGDRDRFSFAVEAATEITVEVFSRRLGQPTDAAVLVESLTQDAAGKMQTKEVAFADDGPREFQGRSVATGSLDPVVTFKAPAAGRYRVVVRDATADSVDDPTLAYVLTIRAARPDFSLLAFGAWPDRLDMNNKMAIASTSLPIGGTAAIDLLLVREEGFTGEVTVTAEGLPPGVTAAPIVIAGGSRRGLLVLEAADDALPATAAFRLVGRATIGGKEVEHQAATATLRWPVDSQKQPHVLRSTAAIRVAVTPDRAPVTVRPQERRARETTPGGTLTIPLSVIHRPGAKTAMSLTPTAYPPELKLSPELKVKELKLPDTKPTENVDSQAELVIETTAKLPPGTHTVVLQGLAKYAFTRNPEAAARLQAAADRVAGIVRERTARVMEAETLLEGIQRQLTEAQQAGREPSADMLKARTQAEESLAQARAAVTAATEEHGRRAKQAADAASKPKDIDVPITMPPITIVVKPAPPTAKP